MNSILDQLSQHWSYKFAFEARVATLLLILNSIARNLTKWLWWKLQSEPEEPPKWLMRLNFLSRLVEWAEVTTWECHVRQFANKCSVLIVQSFHWNGFVRRMHRNPSREAKPFTSRTFSVPTSYYQNKAKHNIMIAIWPFAVACYWNRTQCGPTWCFMSARSGVA